MLLVDKYRPDRLDALDYNASVTETLKRLSQSEDFPHLLFHGPSGAGKRTRIMALLRELFGSGIEKVRADQKAFKTPSNKTLEISLLVSNHHIEVNPSDAGFYDRVVIQELIKEIAQTNSVEQSGHRFKVVILTEVDRMTKDAQQALRRTMEKYSSSCRIIMICNSLSKVMEPVRSRCLPIRVAAPSPDDILRVLATVARKEGITIPPTFANRLVDGCDGNLRRALLMLEASRVNQYPFSDHQTVQQADWERFIQDMAQKILSEQSPKRLLAVRQDLYELLSHCIPPDIILKHLLVELLPKCDESLKYEVVAWAAYYEHRFQLGSKAIFHLEAFVAKFMQLYKKFWVSLDSFGDFE
eukprot:TRINITY_DN4607_c0_g5_i1.p1 TRINITY_DN4607_c0_g5~~TRINITY_DN4607_c0_g5_i1.p1  ORF type:complete len:356 (+),score=86.12 TRINITY_DN4607_c0_g5_i1:79-1146(+)